MTILMLGPYTQGEIPAPVTYTFQDSTGSGLGLDNGYTATVVIQRPSGTVVEADATLEDDTVTYEWAADDLEQPGVHRAVFWVDNGTNRYASEPVSVFVRRAPVVASDG